MDTRNSLFKQAWELHHWATIFYTHSNGRYFEPLEQAERYCRLLGVDLNTFDGLTIIDIGCGAFGALSSFRARLKFGVDILSRSYLALGADHHDMIYLSAPAEDMPFTDCFVDVVMSVNALDHVDDLSEAIREIARVLKIGGRALLAFNLDNERTISEPSPGSADYFEHEVSKFLEIQELRRLPADDLPTGMNLAAPHGLLVVDAVRTSTDNSIYVETTRSIMEDVTGGVPAAEILLRLGKQYGAPKSALGELHADCAFLARERGNVNAVRSHVIHAFSNHARLMNNRGLWSILVRPGRRKAS